MARWNPIPMKEAGLLTRIADRLLKAQSKMDPSPAALLGHNQPVLFSFMAFGAGYTRWRSLPAGLKRLVHLRTAMRVGCPS